MITNVLRFSAGAANVALAFSRGPSTELGFLYLCFGVFLVCDTLSRLLVTA